MVYNLSTFNCCSKDKDASTAAKVQFPPLKRTDYVRKYDEAGQNTRQVTFCARDTLTNWLLYIGVSCNEGLPSAIRRFSAIWTSRAQSA